ncbi:hypothetical protein PHAVU_010G075200 [Phaseolus vulgaris]|uniref:Pectin acetylesterase n=1 Tax=Phaseolus vulgaris TaxID=3885 RepID=V7AME0_PHAVU|nr:hypothetical protein PHAVU_010G075200g [Phaseolus vulgaris]ESW06772.1 hypothetical protein PHAVU_010G075200g [Phaseolus vulgaris]
MTLKALLSGCSVGGLAAIIHCDEFCGLFPMTRRVKCLSDAGLFLYAIDVSGGRTLRNLYGDVVGLQCFFPQNLIASVKTTLFILNADYDSWQVIFYWHDCRLNHAKCTAPQIQYLQGFRIHMLNVIKDLARANQNGLFINSCFSHSQSERQDTWFADNSPIIRNKILMNMHDIALAVGDWYFDRAGVKVIDCPYPCDNTSHHLIFNNF